MRIDDTMSAIITAWASGLDRYDRPCKMGYDLVIDIPSTHIYVQFPSGAYGR